MKQLQKIKEWLNEETEVKIHEIRRLNRMLACIMYIFLVLIAVFIMDFLNWKIEGFDWIYGLVAGTIWELPLILAVLTGITFLVAVIIFLPPLWLLVTSTKIVDKEYVNDPEKTIKWRERKRKHEEKKRKKKMLG